MMPGRALRVSRYRPDAQADGRIRPGPLAYVAGAFRRLCCWHYRWPGCGVAALLGSTVLVMLKGAVVLAFFVWVAAVASRRYGHGSWPRSDGGGIGYTVAVEVVRKPLLTLLVVLGLRRHRHCLVDLPDPLHPGLHGRLHRAAKARDRRARHGSPMAARAT